MAGILRSNDTSNDVSVKVPLVRRLGRRLSLSAPCRSSASSTATTTSTLQINYCSPTTIIMSRRYSLLALLFLMGNASASTPADVPSVSVKSGGAIASSGDEYEALCEKVKCSILDRANKSVSCSFLSIISMIFYIVIVVANESQ